MFLTAIPQHQSSDTCEHLVRTDWALPSERPWWYFPTQRDVTVEIDIYSDIDVEIEVDVKVDEETKGTEEEEEDDSPK